MDDKEKIKIKRLLLSRMKELLDSNSLHEKIDDFVEEYIEKLKFIKKYTVHDLPTTKDIKWWFQDKPSVNYVELKDGTIERNFEINIDKICIGDPLATLIFKYYYDWYWIPGNDIPLDIQEIISLYKKYKNSRKPELKQKYKEQLSNYALVGMIRMYKLERKPYLCPTEIVKTMFYFLDCLDMMLKYISNKKQKNLPEKIYIFDAFQKMKVEEDKSNG